MENRIQILEERYNRLLRNGKNSEGTGVLRRIQRQINKAKQGIILA